MLLFELHCITPRCKKHTRKKESAGLRLQRGFLQHISESSSLCFGIVLPHIPVLFPLIHARSLGRAASHRENTLMKPLMLRVKTHTHLHFSLIAVDVKELFMIELKLSY